MLNSNLAGEPSFNNQLYIFIISGLIVLLIVVIFCANCIKKRQIRREETELERHPPTKFDDVPLRQEPPTERSLTDFLASAQIDINNEKSVVKQGLFAFVTEQFDEPASNPRTVEFAPRKSMANITNFYQNRPDHLERQYLTVNASYKYSPDQDKSNDCIYANFATMMSNVQKKESFGSEQMLSKKPSVEEPPLLAQRFTVQKSADALLTIPQTESEEPKKTKPYEHLHIQDKKKSQAQYENHEIISKNRPVKNSI